ncbi:Tubulin tyrosine ligase [Giardia duodenalis assemblage B]|uniref:Tubulin--tyrosine ligase-like protein 5 n=1 Tax=Giardia duodenalis assemblage B TaxID=1394984 RepID=A0A132NSM1_GIAIN|nr:Tubulin tyrosine ligase [Giardia intestinalis assemblage B]
MLPIKRDALTDVEIKRRSQLKAGHVGDVRIAKSLFPSLGYYYWFLGNVANTTILPKAKPIVRYAGPTTKAIRRTFADAGFVPGPKNCRKFNICWGSPKNVSFYSTLVAGQVCNQVPGSNAIGRKDKLAHCIVAAQNRSGKDVYDFIPKTYILPQSTAIAVREMSMNPGAFYIYKPALGARGEGIRLLSSGDTILDDKPAVLQKYISNPLLVNGYKFDLRIYVLITSVDPFIFYIYNEGLGRFATRKYHKPTMRNKKLKKMHLTNFSINASSDTFVNPDSGKHCPVKAKKGKLQEKVERIMTMTNTSGSLDKDSNSGSNSPDSDSSMSSYDYSSPEEDDDGGQESAAFPSKWKASDLFAHLDMNRDCFDSKDSESITKNAGVPGNGVIQQRIYSSICDLVIKTLIACEPNFYILGHKAKTASTYPRISFGIYGFDIMLQSNGKPILIEVNSSPATATSTQLDASVKYPMIAEALNTIGIPVEKRNELDIMVPMTMTEDEKRAKSIKERNTQLSVRAQTSGEAVRRGSNNVPLPRPQTSVSATHEKAMLDSALYLSAGGLPPTQSMRLASTEDAGSDCHSQRKQGDTPSNTKNGADASPSSLSNKSMKSGRSSDNLSDSSQSRADLPRLPFNEMRPSANIKSMSTDQLRRMDKQGRVRYNLPPGAMANLTEVERRICMQISDEEQRSGMFTRIFPTKEAVPYMNLFENQRYNNIFAMAYVCSGSPWHELV